MVVSIGTRSISKITSITSAFSKYPEMWMEDEEITYTIIPKEVRKDDVIGEKIDKLSGVSCIPKGTDEMMIGAKNRARNAYEYAKRVKRHLWLWSRN